MARIGYGQVLGLTALASVALVMPAWAEWSLRGGSKVNYTDNVFTYSAVFERELLDDPTLPSPALVRKGGDVIWEPSLELSWSPRVGTRPLKIDVKAVGLVYTDKPIFNHGDFRFQLRQRLSEHNSVRLRYQTQPDVFIQENFERRTGAHLIKDMRVTSHIGSLEVARSLGEHWKFLIEGRYGVRLYNDPFAERDTRLWTIGPAIQWAIGLGMTVTVEYLYERGLADGRGDTRFNDDVSYKYHLAELAVTVPLPRSWELSLGYIYGRKRFTSELVGDTEHLGRRDMTHQGHAELSHTFNDRTSLMFGFRRTQRTSTNALFPFNSTLFSVGVEYLF